MRGSLRALGSQMTRLNSQQKEKVSQFRSITGSSDKVAQQCLAVRAVKTACDCES